MRRGGSYGGRTQAGPGMKKGQEVIMVLWFCEEKQASHLPHCHFYSGWNIFLFLVFTDDFVKILPVEERFSNQTTRDKDIDLFQKSEAVKYTLRMFQAYIFFLIFVILAHFSFVFIDSEWSVARVGYEPLQCPSALLPFLVAYTAAGTEFISIVNPDNLFHMHCH